MIIKEMYDKITLVNPCSQATFLSHLDTSVRSLIARHKTKYVVLPTEVYSKPVGIEDEIPVFEEYFNAIYDNILFLLTDNTDRKTDYVQEAEDAYHKVWSRYLNGTPFVDADYTTNGYGSRDRIIEKPVIVREVEAFDASASMLPPGSTPTVEYSDHHFTFGIPQGLRGEPGKPGEQGPRGYQGQQGMQGPKGDRGDIGPQGPIGPRGATGPVGATGERGATGPQGPQGIQGPVGIQGPKGDRGPTGSTGPKGPRGDKGDPGTNGTSGTDGTTFTPSVSAAGIISWTNDGGRENPSSVDLVTAVVNALPSAVGVSF